MDKLLQSVDFAFLFPRVIAVLCFLAISSLFLRLCQGLDTILWERTFENYKFLFLRYFFFFSRKKMTRCISGHPCNFLSRINWYLSYYSGYQHKQKHVWGNFSHICIRLLHLLLPFQILFFIGLSVSFLRLTFVFS